MKKQIRLVLALMAAATLALVVSTACVATPPPGTVYVRTRPPAMVLEVEGTAPGADFYWVPGWHRWDGTRHVWVSGHWEKRPHARAVWHPGTWRHHRNGWYWIEGRWR